MWLICYRFPDRAFLNLDSDYDSDRDSDAVPQNLNRFLPRINAPVYLRAVITLLLTTVIPTPLLGSKTAGHSGLSRE